MRHLLPAFVGLWLGACLLGQEAVVERELPAAEGWRALLIHEAAAGTWYARVAPWLEAHGAPSVLVADDTGALTVLSVYSGKWSARSVVPDRQWLAPSWPADVDPRVPGAEVYAAGRAGNLHQVTVVPEAFGQWRLQAREIGHLPGEEVHTVLPADLQRDRPGDELLVFAISGAVWQAVPAGDGGAFELRALGRLPGRVRDAVVLDGDGGPRVLAVSRSGHLLELSLAGDGLRQSSILQEPMGLGRIARRPRQSGVGEIVYVCRDDGLVLRLQEGQDGTWRREAILAGAQGPRGLAVGRFHADPQRETVAVYGYGKQVQLVSRGPGEGWQCETIWSGEHQGHWLVAGELDGRNGTDELIGVGFGGQVVLLCRPPGFALPGVALPAPPAGGDRRDRRRMGPAPRPAPRRALRPVADAGEPVPAADRTGQRRDAAGHRREPRLARTGGARCGRAGRGPARGPLPRHPGLPRRGRAAGAALQPTPPGDPAGRVAPARAHAGPLPARRELAHRSMRGVAHAATAPAACSRSPSPCR